MNAQVDTILRALELMLETADYDFGEEITHLEHAMQTYYHLKDQDLELRVAGFWHDLGHSYCQSQSQAMLDEDGTILGMNDHDSLVKQHFTGTLTDRICQIMGMHTIAKRYQCERDGIEKLSLASTKTLDLEGGLLSDEERTRFTEDIHFKDALILRNADNAGKDPAFSKDKYPKLLLSAILDTLRVWSVTVG